MKFNAKSQRWKDAKVFLLASLLLCVFALTNSFGQGLPVAKPEAVGMNSAKLAQIEQLVNADIADKKLPGAVVIVGHKGKIVYRKAFGNRALVPNVEKMTVDTIFDVASLTKVVATTTSIMILVEQGKLRLSDTIGKFIPDIDDPEAKKVTIQQLLTHTSGYAPDFDLREKWTGREGMLAALKKEKLRTPPGTRFVYSDIGFIVLGEIVQRVTKLGANEFAGSEVFAPLSARRSFYSVFRPVVFDNWVSLPVGVIAEFPANLADIAPTENIRGQNSYLGSKFDGANTEGDRILRAAVHDPTAFRMGGAAGHAGLFSTADDLARFCQMLLNGGVVPGRNAKNKDRATTRK
jgi:CubicO group peptidase (beta-lactamase class C family)